MGLSYADAVLLMGGKGNRTVARIDGLLGGVLLAASVASGGFVLNLFDVKNELAELSDSLISQVGQRISGLDRYSRTERLIAAHAVISIAAYFEVLSRTELPFDPRELKVTKADQVFMAGGGPPGPGRFLGPLVDGLIRAEVPMPSPQQPTEISIEEMRIFYRGLSGELMQFISHTAVWEGFDGVEQARLMETLSRDVPNNAIERYEERFRQLAVEFPEMAFWINRIEHQSTRQDIQALGAGMAALEHMLSGILTGRLPDERRLALSRAYQAALQRPVLTSKDTPPGLMLPLLRDAYVIPDFKAVKVTGAAVQQLSNESWWETLPVRHDLEKFLFGYLLAPQAPLLVLGQPGSGKSVLTQMLAAQLPSDKFLVVRVVLREVAVEADFQTQIEESIRSATGERVTWPDLVRGADGILPVVLLDGFDELLQATGVSQSDYIQRVGSFQAREAALGRQLAILITSRTAVADRATPPPGTVVIRIEPFQEMQVRKWVDVWNNTNMPGFTARGIRPLSVQAVLEHVELASQPLLLIMLALYDADGNQLQEGASLLNEAELYERLLISFAEREMEKSGADPRDAGFRSAVERELLRLSVVALAMLARGRQWVSATELDSDIQALLGTPGDQIGARGMRAPLTAAQIVVGRFFFVHEARANRDNTQLHAYEFLHATFGEYLIARLVTQEVVYLAETSLNSVVRVRPEPLDDAFIYSLLSFVPLTVRGTIGEFAAERIRQLPAESRTQLSAVLLDLFNNSLATRHDTRYADYMPAHVSVPARHAIYSANLALLAVISVDKITGRSLFAGSSDPASEWRSISMLWRSQLPAEGWDGLIDAIDLERTWTDEHDREIVLSYSHVPRDTNSIDLYWSYNRQPDDEFRSRAVPFGWSHRRDSKFRRQSWFLCDEVDDTVMFALSPLERELDGAICSFHSYWPDGDGRAVSSASALTNLWIRSSSDCSPEELAEAFDECIDIAIRARFGSDTAKIQGAFRRIVLRQLMGNRDRVPKNWLNAVATRIKRSALLGPGEVRDAGELIRIANEVMPTLMDGADTAE